MAEAQISFDELDGIAAAAGPGPDRRRHRRADDGEGDRAGARQAADRRQSSGSARAHGAADRRDAVSLLPVSRLRRPYPNSRRARRRRLCAARRHGRRRDRRGLRQDREIARPRLSRRPAGRERGGARRSRALRAAAADERTPRCRFFAVRAEDRAAARGGENRAAERPGCRRSLRLVPAGGGRCGQGPAAQRLAHVPAADRHSDRAGLRRRRRRQSGDPQSAAPRGVRNRHRTGGAAAGSMHRQRRHDRLGRRRAAGARPDRSARFRAARPLAAR